MIEPKNLIAPEDFKAHWKPEMTEEQYHADKSAVGSSSVRLMLESPRKFYWGHFKGYETEETNDMRLGRIIHMALLEGSKFQERYIVMPVFEGYTQKGELTTNPNCKEVKDKREAWLAENSKRVVVTEAELEMIEGICSNVLDHPQGRHVFANGKTEQCGYYRDPETGILCKIKPDFHGNDFFLVTEFKTARSSQQMLFGATAFGKLRYDIQPWMQSYGVKQIENRMPKNQFFLVAEKVWPFEVGIFHMTDEQRGQAEYDYKKSMRRLKECIVSGQWPMRQAKMEPLYTPKFFIDNDVNEHEKELDDDVGAAKF